MSLENWRRNQSAAEMQKRLWRDFERSTIERNLKIQDQEVNLRQELTNWSLRSRQFR